MRVHSFFSVSLAFSVFLVSIYAYPFYHWIILIGLFRTPKSTQVPDGDLIYIEDTMLCEDIHHHVPSNLLFAACEDSIAPRFSWFPPLNHLSDPTAGVTQGSIHVIDPETMKSRRLNFTNFESTYVTHGIDVITDPLDSNAVFIAAINHVPNPDYLALNATQLASKRNVPRIARSQIELFRHVLHTDNIQHVRSIRHPLITTPNDIAALTPTSFYVTNDHYYLDGIGRVIEDSVGAVGKWSNVVQFTIDSPLEDSTQEAEAGINATLALEGIQTANGLGHGPSPDTLLLTSAAGGILYVVTSPLLQSFSSSGKGNDQDSRLAILEKVYLDSTIDNPSCFTFRESSGESASYIILPGLTNAYRHARACSIPSEREPVIMWLVPWDAPTNLSTTSVGAKNRGSRERRAVFQDDGTRVRSASGNVVVPIADSTGKGQKKGWLFITGYNSESIIAVKIDL